jgi:hypothetical protein
VAYSKANLLSSSNVPSWRFILIVDATSPERPRKALDGVVWPVAVLRCRCGYPMQFPSLRHLWRLLPFYHILLLLESLSFIFKTPMTIHFQIAMTELIIQN